MLGLCSFKKVQKSLHQSPQEECLLENFPQNLVVVRNKGRKMRVDTMNTDASKDGRRKKDRKQKKRRVESRNDIKKYRKKNTKVKQMG